LKKNICELYNRHKHRCDGFRSRTEEYSDCIFNFLTIKYSERREQKQTGIEDSRLDSAELHPILSKDSEYY